MISAMLLVLALPCAAFLPPPQPLRPVLPRPTTALAMRGGHGKSGRKRRRRRVHHVDADVDEVCCPVLDRRDMDHLGLAKSIDQEYAIEEAKRNMSFWEVLERERNRPPEDISAKSRGMSALARTRRRMTYSRGNVESKYTLMAPRSYGEPELLDRDHMENPPSLEDLNQRPAKFKESYWSRTVFRYSVVAGAYVAFPLFLKFFNNFQTVDPYDFDIVVEQLAPNVGVLYATVLALTLKVLYQRLTRIEENVTLEAMLLSQVTRNLLSLFADETEWANEACQVVANQLRIMLSRTRGVEMLSIMKSDTYSNLLAIINDYHYLNGCNAFSPREESVTNQIRIEIGQLMETRSLRLSDEAASLPPTHFLLLFSLSFVSIVAFVTASFKVTTDLAHPPQEASLLFAGLTSLYILFFNFCRDLNGPFAGVYQIKRSNAVSHLMQTKWLIKTQLGDAVDFSENAAGKPTEAAGDLKAFFAGPDKEDITAVDATTMQTLVAELESAGATSGPGGTGENHGEEAPTEGSKTEDIATEEAKTGLTLLDEVESAVDPPNPEEDPHAAARSATMSLGHLGDDGGARLLSMKAELSRLKLLKEQLGQGDQPAEKPDPEARLHGMMEELARLKRLNQQLTGHNTHNISVQHDPPTADEIDLSVAAEAFDQATLATAVDETAPEKTPRATLHGVSWVEQASKRGLPQMEEELAGLKELHQRLTETAHTEDDTPMRRAGVGERRRP